MRQSILVLLALMTVLQTPSCKAAEEASETNALIEKLNAEEFDDRRTSFGALEKMGEDARKALEVALASKPPLETRTSILKLLEKLPPKRALYAKILVPSDAAGANPNIKVESWIGDSLKLSKDSQVSAVMDWCLVDEDNGTTFTTIQRCIRPFAARISRFKDEKLNRKIKVIFRLDGPLPIAVRGDVLDDDMGARGVAFIGTGDSYVALFLGPEPNELRTYQRDKLQDENKP